MTDYVVLAPPGVTVRTVENVAMIDAPVLLERDKLDAWVQLQAALKAARDAGIDVAGLEEHFLPPASGVARAPERDSDDQALDDDVVVELERRGKRVYQTPNLDDQQVIGKCGQGFNAADKQRIARHMQTCGTCRVDPRIEKMAMRG